MSSLVEVLGALGGIITVIGAIVTGFFTYRVRMRKIEQKAVETLRTEDELRAQRLKEREDAFNERVDKTLAELQRRYDEMAIKYSELQGEHITTLHRLDTLERQRERDVVRIKELEQKVISLGGTL